MGAVRTFTEPMVRYGSGGMDAPTAGVSWGDGISVGDGYGIAKVTLPWKFWNWSEFAIFGGGELTFYIDYGSRYVPNGEGPDQWGLLGNDWSNPPVVVQESIGLYAMYADSYAVSVYAYDSPEHQMWIEWGLVKISGRNAFAVTWHNLGRDTGFSETPFDGTVRNTFQIVIYEGHTFEYNYDTVEWDICYTANIWQGLPGGTGSWMDYNGQQWYFDYGVGGTTGYLVVEAHDSYATSAELDAHWYDQSQLNYFEISAPPVVSPFTYIGSAPPPDRLVTDRVYIDNSPLINTGSKALIHNSINSNVKGRYIFFPETDVVPHRMKQRDDGYGVQDKSSRLPSQARNGASKQASGRIGMGNNYQ